MFNIKYTRLALLICLLATAGAAWAQQRSAREKALTYLHDNYTQFGLKQEDVADVRVTDEFSSPNNGLTHVWLQQQFHGVPVFNALLGLHVSADGKQVYHVGHRFVADLARKVNTTLPSLGAATAVQMMMINLKITGISTPSLRTKLNEQNFIFEGGAVSRKDIPVVATFVPMNDGSVHLAWTMTVDQVNTSDLWTICVDAQTGEIVRKINNTVYCATEKMSFAADEECSDQASSAKNTQKTAASGTAMLADETYNVFALPTESPAHGPRTLLVNPADATASPFGWLDTDGAAGAEYTYTRGNNVWAYDDSGNDDTPSAAESADGGAGLNFDFPFDPSAEPVPNKLAAITNLFYMNNMMHDITYHYGFTEEAGNFQENNYGKSGAQGDAVHAEAQDGSGTDNANFSTPPDGQPGRMQMYLWGQGGGKIVKVNAPGVVSGIYFGGQGGWGGAITSTPLTADVVFVNDDQEPTVGCETPTNDVQGKILMVDRGECEFGYKALLAEQAGAVACIVCDHEQPPITGFGAGDYGGQVTIPALWMKKADCALLRQHAGAGLNISLVQPTISGPENLDGDVDNGIIAHEYGHGISNRLTGGPSNTGCLGNAEQMGEGWSDFFALITTVKPGDTGEKKRGLGTYVFRQDNDQTGIRRYPYSTDMSINPLTFSTVGENPEVHALGEVWTAMVWDLYWALVEKYGYDADISNANSGNSRAIQLVMDGMKLQPCGPGFQDGRDAIRLADVINYNGADTCLISTVFARRGLGYLASQNSPDDAADGIENFDPIPTCIKELKIKKITTTPLVKPGENMEFKITVTNHKDDTAPGVTVTDELPAGCTLVSATNGGSVMGNMIVWNLGDMPSGQVIEITYVVKTAANAGSQPFFYDPMDTEDNWYSLTIDQTSPNFFFLQSDDINQDQFAWQVSEPDNLKTDCVLETFQEIPVTGTNPVLRFWHKYNTETSADPGFLEFRDVNASPSVWRRVTGDATFRNGYNAKVAYGGAYAFPNQYGFSGNSDGWEQSYFDLSQFAGKTITFRFRFGTDDNTAPADGRWVVDQVEMLDMFNYDTEACVTSTAGDQACDQADERGVIMDPVTVATHEPVNAVAPLGVQPNPARDFVSVTIPQQIDGQARLSLLDVQGREVKSQDAPGFSAGQIVSFNVQNLPAGVYMLQLESATIKTSTKVVIR